jgi:hypothetical protein
MDVDSERVVQGTAPGQVWEEPEAVVDTAAVAQEAEETAVVEVAAVAAAAAANQFLMPSSHSTCCHRF